MLRWRHFIVAITMVPALGLYVLLCMFLADYIVGIHLLLDLLFFLIAGIAWIFPASSVIKWLADSEAK